MNAASRSMMAFAVTVALLSACSDDPSATTAAAESTTAQSTTAQSIPVPSTGVPATTATTTAAPTTTGVLADPTEPELRDELLEMLAADQAERTMGGSDGTVPPNNDAARTTRLREIIGEHGWPTWDLVGVDGSTAAWAIAQHSDQDVAFQQEALALLEAAAAEGNGSPGEVAYLTDRVAVNTGELQVYGTQLAGCADGGPAAAPMIDEERVDERRASVGLGTMEEYFAEFEDFGC